MLTDTDTDLQIITADQFHRLGPEDFGMPGLVAVESVGPHVELMQLGPFITIHDSIIEKGLGIGHHPHRFNERLFYILAGQIKHDDSMNGITGEMNDGDLGRLTEGERGMLHSEWNGRDDVDAHAIILVYPIETDPPIERAAFDALRADDRVRVEEAEGVETLHLIGGESTYRVNNPRLATFFDTTLAAGASFEHEIGPREGLILYPVAGTVSLPEADAILRGSTDLRPEGPDALAIAWSDGDARRIRVEAADGPGRVLRIGFGRGDDDVILHQPWTRR
jgi:redox-sensitive bicupin YhaK (pirin superfamily)